MEGIVPRRSESLIEFSVVAHNRKSYLTNARSRIQQFWGDAEESETIAREITSVAEYEIALNGEVAVLFKHSPTCGFSRIIYSRLKKSWPVQPDAALYLISVRQSRDLARYVAQHTGITHESPQVIVFRRGRVIGTASHERITAEQITALLASQ